MLGLSGDHHLFGVLVFIGDGLQDPRVSIPHDPAEALLTRQPPDESTPPPRRYERDAVGNPVSILREDGSVIYYEYDAKHQLAIILPPYCVQVLV